MHHRLRARMVGSGALAMTQLIAIPLIFKDLHWVDGDGYLLTAIAMGAILLLWDWS